MFTPLTSPQFFQNWTEKRNTDYTHIVLSCETSSISFLHPYLYMFIFLCKQFPNDTIKYLQLSNI